MSHPFIFDEKLNTEIDEQVYELVKVLNSIDNVVTVSSCQGDPGQIEVQGGAFGHVAFYVIPGKNYALYHRAFWSDKREVASTFLFDVLRPLVFDLWDDVRLELTSSDVGFTCWVRFRNESIPELVKRFKPLVKSNG